MTYFFRVITTLIFSLSFQALAFGQTFDLEYLNQKLSYFPEAKRFEATYKDLVLQGIEVGPEDGIPLIFVGGFTSNLPIYRKIVREFASRGFRVFNYNPPGQGSDELLSIGSNPTWQNFEGLVQALEIMHRTVYKMTDQKVVVAGHSLGGMQGRVFSLGLKGLRTGQLSISDRKQREVLEHTSALIPVFSPSIHLMSSRYKGMAYSKLIEDFANYFLRNTMPKSMEAMAHHRENMPFFMKEYFAWLDLLFLGPAGYLAEKLVKWVNGRHLDFKEMREVGHLGLSSTIHPEIVDSLQEWNIKGGAISSNGFDMGKTWMEKQVSEDALATYLMVAKKDALAPEKELLEEAHKGNMRSRTFKGGHIDPLFDNDQVPAIVDQVIDFLIERGEVEASGCNQFFKAS